MSGVVVGIDGSRHSQRALEWAVREAAMRQLPLTVIYVYRSVAAYWGGAADFPKDGALAGKARGDAREATHKALALAGDELPENVTVRAVNGLAAEELIGASQTADMVVVGSRGTGGFARLLLGSVTSQVAHHAHCPVVVIPAEDRR